MAGNTRKSKIMKAKADTSKDGSEFSLTVGFFYKKKRIPLVILGCEEYSGYTFFSQPLCIQTAEPTI